MGKQSKARKHRVNAKMALLNLFIEVATPIFEEAFRPDRCVNGTRVALEVLVRLGLNPRPMVTHATAMNTAFWTLLKGNKEWPSQDLINTWVKEHGAWAIAVGGGPPDMKGYDAHLVTVVQDHLLDTASGQFARPDKQIVTPPMLIAPVTTAFMHGTAPAILGSGNIDDGTVSYMARPVDVTYLDLPGFQAHSGNLRVARQVFDQMHKRILETGPQRHAASS